MSRCVECSRPKEAHDAGNKCPTQNTHYGTMRLPEGQTCNNCRHFGFCSAFIGDVSGNQECDWYPIRFVPTLRVSQ